MQLQITDARAGVMLGFALIASLAQFILLVLAVLAMRRMAIAQEAASRHLESLIARTAARPDVGSAR